ncbi:PurK Phosphoribosylaminoimidazole carboxylase (NCAIR synthetase) [actinobacterium SCGC AAA044-D11]
MSFPRVGVIGAGQLARMMAVPANDLGIDFKVFAAIPNDSAAQVTNFVLGDYSDVNSVLAFAKECDVLTFEHELVPQSVIKAIEAAGIKVYPRAESFTYSQDKLAMRGKIAELNLPNPKWQKYQGGNSNIAFPLIAKLPTGGYDGRGVYVVESENELAELQKKFGTLLLEEKLNFDYEISVMVARSPHNQAATWPATLTIQENGICTSTITPVPNISDSLAEKVQRAALEIAAGISLVGVMAVEMFVIGEDFYINELALRPHNSGHWSIEGSETSQFEQHLRAILDLPLGSTSMRSSYAVMGNVLGGAKSDMYRPYLHLMARTPDLKFHQYGKEVKPGRKIGHVTMCGENLLQLQEEIAHAVDYMNGVIDE